MPMQPSPWVPYLCLFLAALIMSLMMTPVAHRIAWQLGAVDRPGKRRINKTAIPRMGGIAVFLGIIAVVPIFISMADDNLRSLSMGGTTILIAVSVALETTRTLESQLMMRHHKGFLQ